ncbi:MAG TPA: hypothetical protein VGR66_03145 [Candidatus Eisenbacteria bacterium]|jgi:hypothetical protein|nr:hypothetical protein [Candidatus Eisenbacteria bacterium]
MRTRIPLAVALLVLAVGLSCSKPAPVEVAGVDQRPSIELSTAPQQGDSVFYVVKFTWFSYDPDGQVLSFRYAVDPPFAGDTAWVQTTNHDLTLRFKSSQPGSGTPSGIAGTDYHVFAIVAVDDQGLPSAVQSVAFTSYTVAPTARLLFPTPNHLITAVTPTSVRLQWTGTDPDGPNHVPVKYKIKLVEQTVVQTALGLGSLLPTASDLQSYFSREGPAYASWDSMGSDTTVKQYNGLTPGTVYYFAVLAIDEVGAYDPRFDLDRNLLRFRPSSELLGPKLTVYNDIFTASASSVDLSPSRLNHVPMPSGEVFRFNWSATPPPGGTVVGYRWVLDPVNGDLSDETPRDNDSQTYRWSGWALEEQSTTVGPYTGDEPHYLYVEARDNSGGMSLVQVEVDVETRVGKFLVVDDFMGPPDMDYGPTSPNSFQPYGNFPTEAVLDTLLYAVGGKPYQHRPAGTLSQPGMFAGFDYDTLDYRFRRTVGLPLELLFRYPAVILYCGVRDGTGPSATLGCLRYITFRQTPNPLAAYVAHGGKLFLFGDGVIYSLMLRPGDSSSQIIRIITPGSFLYDYMKLQSGYKIGGSGTNPLDYMIGATPYLQSHITPGRRWPVDTLQTFTRVCDDPRVGPSSVRNQSRWGGLPCLDLTTEFNDWPSGFPGGLKTQLYVSTANSIIQILADGKSGSALDTLYLWRAVNYIGGARATNPDGKPVMCAYEGPDSGPLVWSGVALWFFDRQELRQLARAVLGSFGIQPATGDPSLFRGPGSAEHVADGPPPSAGARPIASARPSE